MSDKVLLVIDTPESCLDCQFCYEYDEGIEACCTISREPDNNDSYREIKEDYCQCKPDWCLLKPVPRKKNYKSLSDGNPVKAWGNGWNACIDDILEGCKDE